MNNKSAHLTSLLPGDLVGGKVLLIGVAGVDSDFLKAVSKRAERITIVEEEDILAGVDEIRKNTQCDVDQIKKEQANVASYSLILCNETVDADLASSCLKWLLPDGYVMFIKRCRQVNEAVVDNPDRQTTYSLDRVFKATAQENSFGFVFVASRIVTKYEDQHVLYSSVFKKVLLVPGQDRRLDSLQDVLNDKTYNNKILKMIEKGFSQGGSGFVSTGGAEVTEHVLKRLNLQPGQKVLDVGCGAGGPAIMIAKKFDVSVIGVDISSNMIDEASEEISRHPKLNVEFEVCDVERREFPECYFDAIYSKDVILHIVRKPALFKKFLKWLKPGGKLLITDYCRNENDFTELMECYMKKRGNIWFLITLDVYGQYLKDTGFVNVEVHNENPLFRESTVKEKENLVKTRDVLLKEFDQKFLDEWIDAWELKVKLIDSGDTTWGLFYAEKSQ